MTNRKALAPGGHSFLPRTSPFKILITLLPVIFSQLDPGLGVGWGKKVNTLVGYLLTDGLNCLTVKYLAGWHLE